MERLRHYTSKNSRDDTVRVLNAFLDFLPSDGRRNLVQDLESFETDEQVRMYATSLVQSLLIPMKAERTSPDIVLSPRRGLEGSIDNIASEITESATRVARLKKDCLRRDGKKCAITGICEAKSLPEDSTARSVHTECAYIIPFSFGDWKTEQELQTKAIVWVTLNRCFPSLRQRINFHHESINDHRNAITMWSDLHHHFGDFTFALEATDVEHCYRIKTYKPGRTWYLQSDRVTFVSHDDRYELPSPELLEVHAIVARILHASGKAEEIEKLIRERDEIAVLAKDGSTDVSALLATTSLGVLDSQNSRSGQPLDDKARNRATVDRSDRSSGRAKENVKR